MANEHPATITMRAHSATERWLLSEIERARGAKPVSADCTFEDLGFKSLDFIELVMAAEEQHRVEIPDGLSLRCETPAQLAALIDRLCDEAKRYA